MTFDLEALLRTIKPEKSVGPLSRRRDGALRFVDADTADTPPLIDTTVYIDGLRDSLPAIVSGHARSGSMCALQRDA